MAKAKVVPSDQGGSAEFDELRKLVHTLLHLLQTLNSTDVTDAATLLAAAQAIGDAVANGVTSSALGSREVLGVIPKTQRHQSAQMSSNRVALSTASKNY
jgi:hypothetical protein